MIPPATVGVLESDIDCIGGTIPLPAVGILLERGAGLDLNGHTLNFVKTPSTVAPIACPSRCDVFGAGVIASPAEVGVAIVVSRRVVKIRDIQISGFQVGISTSRAKVVATNVSITSSVQGISFGTNGIVVDHVDVTITEPSPHSSCVSSGTLHQGRVTGTDLTLTGCRSAVVAERVKLTNLTITGSEGGVFASTIRLTDSSVTGSTGSDLFSRRMPHLVGTTCGSSGRILRDGTFGTWGVCTND